MKIWLVNSYGPIEGENWRDYSFNQFGKYLASQGHDVIWWTSNFAHHFKQFRSKGWKDIQVCNGFVIRLVPTSAYYKNFGFARIYKDIIFARNAKKGFLLENKPNIILVTENPLTMGNPSFKYARDENIPIIIDQMDMWPEFFEKKIGKVGTILHFFLKPIYLNRIKNYYQAAGYLALGRNYLNFARNIAPDSLNKPYALVYNGINIDNFRKHLKDNLSNDVEKILRKSKRRFRCIFAGTFGPSYDIKVTIECAKICKREGLNVDFIFAGNGPCLKNIIKATLEEDNIFYLGSLKPSELIPVYGRCDIGLCAYSKASNVDMPDKFYDYCGAGLAIVNSLTEEVAWYITSRNLGINYDGGNSNSMYDAVKKLISDEELLKKIKENSLKMAAIFDSTVQNKKLLTLIENVLNREKL